MRNLDFFKKLSLANPLKHTQQNIITTHVLPEEPSKAGTKVEDKGKESKKDYIIQSENSQELTQLLQPSLPWKLNGLQDISHAIEGCPSS